ncbi:indolethylamine N-methyltransferase-like isoform 2-T2 [Anomaloglossus baeobatrachus]|uniref:indolethylamine N-methyltransferase-like isoform X1 n=1 Tax=Anomaloglossus baeobatrachus TaxID=238106 RepID=UPI003F501EAE
MASSPLLDYTGERHHAKNLIENHFSSGEISFMEECVGSPLKLLHDLFSSGKVKGDTLLNVSISGVLFPIFSASNVFKKIYVMNFTDSCDNHFKAWLEKKEGATDWSFVSKRVCQLEGNEDEWQEKEEQVRKAIEGVVKFDITAGSVASVVLPQVDCVMCVYLFNVICHNKEDITRNLKILTSWLKVGGHLVFIITLNMSFYRVGQHKFVALTVDEKFVKESVTKAGFVIEKEEVIPTSVESDMVDYKNLLFLVARKERSLLNL